jgi:uncharacterized membrane-anchored protein
MKKSWNQNRLSLILIALNSFFYIFFLIYASIQKEDIRENGTLVLLPLMPVDPRSLFQGDYMILRYDWSKFESTYSDKTLRRGYLQFEIEDGVMKPVQLSDSPIEENTGLYSIKFFRSDYDFKIGAESFFFQEGQADVYSKAKYSGIKFLPDTSTGDKLLVGLYDENKNLLKSSVE